MAATLTFTTPVTEIASSSSTTPSRKRFFARLFEAIMEARMRQALREVERYRQLVPTSEVERAGYKVTLSTDAVLPFTS